MPPPKVTDLQVVVLYVKSVARSAKFYGDLLGLEKVYQVHGRVAYQAGRTLILLHPPDQGEFPKRRPATPGWGVAIYLAVDDVDEAVKRLRAKKAKVFEGPIDEPWGERDAGILDPDGYHVHLSQSGPGSWLRNLPIIRP